MHSKIKAYFHFYTALYF